MTVENDKIVLSFDLDFTLIINKEGILNWDEICRVIREFLLCDPEYLETLCKECHKQETERQNNEKIR